MLRLVIALALGASTQAFVAAPQHRLPLSSYARGHSSSPAIRIRHGDGLSKSSRPRRGYAVSPARSNKGVSMRVGRAGRGNIGVEIEGVGGETRRVERRTRRRPDLRSMQQIGAQTATAAAVLVQQQDEFDVQTEDKLRSLSDEFQTSDALRQEAMMEDGTEGTVQDKYTQIYVPADGIIIKKTYGFWTWQVIGAIFAQHFIRNIIRKGGSLEKTTMEELNWDHIVTEPEHLLELKAYCCEECGYTLFPARGRHEVFFGDVEDFKCPECDAPRSAFYDANDKNDPHNQKVNEAPEAAGKGEGAGDIVASGEAGESPSASGETTPSATSAAPSASSPSSPKQAPPEPSVGSSAAGKEDPSPANDERQKDADGEDDLLDF
ncbi:unnamed protein product [Pylaiella littoralis]